MKVLTKQEMEDLLIGTEIFGTGGGGPVEWGKELIEEVYKKGKEFRIIEPREVPDEDLVVVISRIGGGVSEEIKQKIAKYEKIRERPTLVAARQLAKYLDEEPAAYIPTEVGAGNTVIPMYVAAMLDKPTVDADCCGNRAKPELGISTTNLKGVPISPIVVVTPFGEIIILRDLIDDHRAEDFCRQIAVYSGGISGMARCPMRGKTLRDATVSGSISLSIRAGKSIREARESGKNPVDAFLKATGSLKIFEGSVKKWERDERGAFMWGTFILDGISEYKGHTLKVWFKNEHLISWLDDEPYVLCPDLILTLDAETGRGMSNWVDLTKYLGKKVVVVGMPAADIWRSDQGIELFGPRHFGYDIDFKQLEEVRK